MDVRRATARRLGGRTRTRIVAVAALGVGMVAAGCGEDILGVDATHVLVLESVNGQPLPATLDEGGATRIFVADTIRLLGDGTWSRVQVHRWALQGDALQDLHYSSSGTLRQSGNALVLDEECNDVIILASCIPPDTLVPTDDGWIIQRGLAPGEPVLRFEQIDYVGPR